MHAFRQGNDWVEFTGQKLPLKGEKEDYNVPRNWSDAEKEERFSLFKVAEPAVPAGKRVVSYTITTVQGRPSKSYVLEDIPVEVPHRVSARQFKMQLVKDGLLEQVEAWVATQEKLVQVAYAEAGTFLRTEPMLQAGFSALGFDSARVDEFYTNAATI